MKKVYQITGTEIFGTTKQELKPKRNELNDKALGRSHADTVANQWPHRITKGPDHPHLAKR